MSSLIPVRNAPSPALLRTPLPLAGEGLGERVLLLRNEFIPPTCPGARAQAGFSLVEILVGLVIGLLASLVIMQVFSVFEGQKRATTGSADAQINGSVALYNIKRDAEMAGFGLPVFSSQNSPLKCTTLPTFDHDGNAATPVIDLFPIVIADGGGLSDTIAIRYGRTSMGGIPSTANVAGTTASFTTNNNMGCQADDWAIISSLTSCAMAKVAATLLSPATRTDWVTMPLTATPAVLSGSIACVGKYQKDSPYDDHSSPLEYLYWVDNGNLVLGGDPATTGSGTPVVAGIVSLQAQYGVSAVANSNQITQWVNATGAWAAPIALPANRNRIKAIRIAVVARNGNTLEKTNVTNACSSTTGANPTGLCAWDGSGGSAAPSIDLSADTNWQKYRYRVFDTIIPLRSMIWSKDNLL